MISGAVALAFTAGMVATFNPCGFSLLPAYIGAFVSGGATRQGTGHRVIRAIGVAAAVSIGFVIVFATAGLVIDRLAGEARRQLPWVTIVIGALLVLAGIATAVGWKPTLMVRRPNLVAGRTGIGAMIGYGATYAIASLSCTIGPFLAVTGAALTQSTFQGIATYIAYALGMGVIILAISVAAALAQSTVTNHMRRITPIAARLGGALMVVAGGYAIWYGRWELAVYDGDLDSDPIVDTIEEIRLSIINTIEAIGAGRLALFVVVTTAAIIAAVRHHGSDTEADLTAEELASRADGHGANRDAERHAESLLHDAPARTTSSDRRDADARAVSRRA